MKKTIFIHIGGYRSGTHEIQKFFSSNRNILEKKGFLYPGSFLAHNDLAGDLLSRELSAITGKSSDVLNKYQNEFVQSAAQTIVLSSDAFEGLYRSPEKIKGFFGDQFEVKIVYYCRRQDEYLESTYNHRIRQPGVFLEKPFSEFVHAGGFQALDYYKMLSVWGDIFGRGNIIVRCYESEQLPAGIIPDFLSVIGIIPDSTLTIPKGSLTQQLNWDLIEVIRICNAHFKDDARFHQFLVTNLEQINRGMNEGPRHLLSPAQRKETIEKYQESNSMVAREFLGRNDGRLFFAPFPDPAEPWCPYEGLTSEKLVPIITQMIFTIDQKYQVQKRTMEKQSFKGKIAIHLEKIRGHLGLLQ